MPISAWLPPWLRDECQREQRGIQPPKAERDTLGSVVRCAIMPRRAASTALLLTRVEDVCVHMGNGNVLDFRVRLTGSAVWVGPAWAVACGAVASGALTKDWHSLVLLLVAVVLADPILGTAWSLASSAGVASPRSGQDNPSPRHRVPSLPYTLPGSLAGRLGELVAERVSRWRVWAGERSGESLLGLGFAAIAAVLLAAQLGVVPALLVAVALAAVFGRLALGHALGVLESILATVVLAGIPWLLGYAVFARPWGQEDWLGSAGAPLLWAATYALVFGACALIAGQVLVQGARLLTAAHAAGIVLLVLAKEPILAGGVALLFLPQVMLQPLMLRLSDGRWYLRRAQVFTLLAMLALAMAMRS